MRSRRDGTWHQLAWADVASLVHAADRWLVARGDPSRLCLVAPPSATHGLIEMAALARGREVGVVYDEEPPEEISRVLELMAPELVLTTAEHVDAVPAGLRQRVALLDDAEAMWRDDVREARADLAEARRLLRSLADEGAAGSVLLQSTGTTAPAKVIVLSVASMLRATWALRDVAGHPHPRLLAFLPSAHTSHQLVNVFVATLLAGEVCFGGGPDDLVDDLLASRPTVLFGSPHLYREVQRELADELTRTRTGRLVRWRLDARTRRIARNGTIARGDVGLLGRLIGRRTARALGLDDTRELFSGTSPLDRETHAFFAAIGWYVRNTYGLSEQAGAATVSAADRMAVGGLGDVVDGVSLRLDSAGQVLLAGPTLMRGYLGHPPLSPGAWLETGDLVELCADGALGFRGRIRNRLGDAGRSTSAERIEAMVEAAFPGTTAVAVAHGDGRAALYVLHDPTQPTTHPMPSTDDVDRFLHASPNPGFEVIDRVAVIDAAPDKARGEYGPTGKLRRWKIAQRWCVELQQRPPAPRPV